ncbi:MAG: nucleotide exchange factor GrpE [Gammaproteobacteria bacterium]|nr:MAG: nucleotide exchange factor GrpE [Gammaproteobacteria bacterium]RKZ72157.1 MAG: nucleotide exchange factor GrpE [Gammaproteobacteria bacterium]
MTGKQQDDVTLEEVIGEVEDQLAGDEASVETDIETATAEITIESLSEQVEALKASAAGNLDKAIRAQAELDNVRKRTTRDVENAHKYALDKFINELLPVLDSMEMGIVASVEAEDVNSLREGLELTLKMFCTSLEKSGVHPVNPQKGDKFNPEQHEAMTMQEVDDAESGTVVTTLQKGYELNGRLIRPAMVIVAK